MANQAAIKFVKQLVAAFSRYPVSEETKQILSQKLSWFKLTQSQWDGALDSLMGVQRREEGLPQPGEIIGALKSQQAAALAERANLGWMYFDLKGCSYAIRIKNDAGIWVNTVGKNAGRSPNIPEAAENLLICPDNPAYQAEEIPTKEEISAYIRAIESSLAKVKSIGPAYRV